MSKKPKKWTKWIEHTGKHCPVDVYEFVKVEFNNPCDYLKKMSAGKFYWGGDQLYTITHYKRLLSNVEAERVARIKNEIDWKTVEENAAWEDAAPDIHESARHHPMTHEELIKKVAEDIRHCSHDMDLAARSATEITGEACADSLKEIAGDSCDQMIITTLLGAAETIKSLTQGRET